MACSAEAPAPRPQSLGVPYFHWLTRDKRFPKYLTLTLRKEQRLVKIHLLINMRQHSTATEVFTLWFTAHTIHHRVYVQAEWTRDLRSILLPKLGNTDSVHHLTVKVVCQAGSFKITGSLATKEVIHPISITAPGVLKWLRRIVNTCFHLMA